MTARGMLANWFGPLLIHNQNQQGAMNRAVLARAQGLDPKEFATVFPGSTVTSTTTNNDTGSGWWKGALLSTALLAGGGGAGVLIGKAGNAVQEPTPPAVVTPAAPPATPPAVGKAYDALTEEQQPDGSWKVIKREHLKGMK